VRFFCPPPEFLLPAVYVRRFSHLRNRVSAGSSLWRRAGRRYPLARCVGRLAALASGRFSGRGVGRTADHGSPPRARPRPSGPACARSRCGPRCGRRPVHRPISGRYRRWAGALTRAQVVLHHVIVERHPEVVQESEHRAVVLLQPIEHVLRRRLPGSHKTAKSVCGRAFCPFANGLPSNTRPFRISMPPHPQTGQHHVYPEELRVGPPNHEIILASAGREARNGGAP